MSVDPLQFYLVSMSALYKKTNKGLSEVLSNPQALNSYAYAINNPVNKVDQNGECVWDACVVEGYAGYMVTTGVVATAGLVYNQYSQQINKIVAGTVSEATELGKKAFDSIKEGTKNAWDSIKNIFKKEIAPVNNPQRQSQQIEDVPDKFPDNPNDFNPKGWKEQKFKDDEIRKWTSPDGQTQYEWDKGNPGEGDHWHKDAPDIRNKMQRIPHPDTGNTHFKPGDRFF